MKIYVDFDDCLCETARFFTVLADDLYGKHVPYEEVKFFDLQKTFALSDKQYEQMMMEAHRPEALLSYKETPGAIETVNAWLDEGHDVSIITGRPYSSYEPSRVWLDDHGLNRVKLYFLNKYGRESSVKNNDFSLEIEDYKKMHFDYAVEDSPSAFKFFDHLPDLRIMVYDRPWNQNCAFPGEHYHRCFSWDSIRSIIG